MMIFRWKSCPQPLIVVQVDGKFWAPAASLEGFTHAVWWMKSGNVVLNTLKTVMQQVKVTVAAVCLTKLEMGLDFLFRLIYFAACLNQGGS